MAHVLEDRVLESSTTTGIGNLTLAGAVTGFRAFSAACSNNDTFYYAAEGVDASGVPTGEWETGLGTYVSATPAVARTRVIRSSNSNAAVSFSAGTKRIAIAPIGVVVNGQVPSGEVDKDGNMVVSYAATVTTPPADNILLAPQRLAGAGTGVTFRTLDEHAVFRSMQPDWGKCASGGHFPNYGANTDTIIRCLGPTSVGNTSLSTPASGRNNREARRGRTTTAATAGLACGYTYAQALFSLGGVANAGNNSGFRATFRWAPSDAIGNGALSFCGVSSNVSAPVATTNPNTFTNSIGIGADGTSANAQLFYGGSAAQTQIDLGANFPINGNGTQIFELIIYAPPDLNNKVYVRTECLHVSTGDSHVSEQILTAATPGTQLPANTTFLAPRNFRSNNATAVSGAIADGGFMYEMNWN
jgi:hypothetical protein